MQTIAKKRERSDFAVVKYLVLRMTKPRILRYINVLLKIRRLGVENPKTLKSEYTLNRGAVKVIWMVYGGMTPGKCHDVAFVSVNIQT